MGDKSDRDILIEQVIERYGNACVLCTDKTWDEQGALAFSLDHWYPQVWCRQQGWTDDEIWAVDNLRPAHRVCNTRKGEILPLNDHEVVIPKKELKQKIIRPEECDTCGTGRLLFPGEYCPVCYSGAQPSTMPKMLQRDPKECDHSKYICRNCGPYGIIERESAFTF